MLGHRRLSIQDLSENALQPMLSNDGKVSIIFNGEVYNFKSLRSDLERKGYEFRTTSDTEVILNSYLEMGENCVEQFIGMFALIIVDERGDQPIAFAMRDRLGIKPLYCFDSHDRLIFSSEVKAILPLAGQSFGLDREAVSSYLSFRHPVNGNTFFKGVNSIPPASIVNIVESRIECSREYWSLADYVTSGAVGESEVESIERFDELFSSAIDYRMISDVPVGAYLSGGVDSSLIAAKMSMSCSDRVKTYTVAFSEESYDEFEYSVEVANQYGTDHRKIEIEADNYFEVMNELIHFKDAPLSVPNEVPLYLMSKELRKDITVVLSGEGADEIFGGYGRIFRSSDDIWKISQPDCSSEFKASYDEKYHGKLFNSEIDHFIWIYSYIKPEEKAALLSRKIDWREIDESITGAFSSRFRQLDEASYLTKMMFVFETLHLRGLLSRVDTTTMAASVEARVPFVDHRVVEFAFSLPEHMKIKWKSADNEKLSEQLISDDISENHDIPKYLLKKYGESYLSDRILYRRKMGFPVPLDTWFEGQIRSMVMQLIADPKNPAHEVFDRQGVLDLVCSFSGSHEDALKVWMVLNIFTFCKFYSAYLKEV